uniref:recombinase family protein n=1 Tax=Enterocloster clostridioformis TaxID=1531 RepID=UPI00206EDCD6|nr:MAG TPA: integrase [Caudoviricetes sp.]
MKIEIREGRQTQERKLRVCAYCRVSTDADEQENSLENQMQHYEKVIKANPAYEYVGVYSDFAISGFKDKRPGFQSMLADARAGKIDLIMTKSVSRFARNTAIVLEATRELKERNVGVFFELQNINTLSGEGELMLTILAAFAQAESESGSEGAKMVYRRKYEQGIPVQYLERSFGYTKDDDGNYVPDEKEMVWVKKMFQMAADGYTPAAIKRFLNDKGVLTVGGAKWIDSAVIRILENEIYKGDYIMHKHYVNEERKLVRNRGEVDAWYIENDHKAIVSESLWQKAQEAIGKKREYLATASVIKDFTEENYPYMNKIFCAKCGHPLQKRIYSKGNRLNWGCTGTRRFGKEFCEGVNIPDGVLREAWRFEENMYIGEKPTNKGIKEFTYLKESSWKRRYKKKILGKLVPDNTEENYPYKNQLFCRLCGSRLVRHYNPKNKKVFWICNRNKRQGKESCTGVRVPDSVIRAWGSIKGDIYIEGKVDRNGKKRYSYSGTKPTKSE